MRTCNAVTKRKPCFKDAVGYAQDAYGKNYYCEEHLVNLEKSIIEKGWKGILIVRFLLGENQK